jgi:phage terminase large subunit-like protein
MTQEEKKKALRLFHNRFVERSEDLMEIEPRLVDYFLDLQNNSGLLDTIPDHHNAYEILGALKFLRLFRTYELDIETFHDVIYKYEGTWEKHTGVWHHIEGGLKHPGTTGPMYYRLQPFQVFVLSSMFLLKVWVNTEAEAGTRELLPTEKIKNGIIYDLRRLCTEFTFYTPRKTAKTQLSAFIQFWYFMSGDENAECFCCANASDQAKILFSRSRELIHQMDPKERRIRFTASQVNWKPGQFRTASLTALSAGGKTKDGLFAQLCSADEYGSAAYVNGASDMGKLVSVVESSMGPRREPMTFISTTAGINTTGPFVDKLAGIKQLLEQELDPEAEHDLSTDRQMCLLLEPDEWEMQDQELLLTSKDVRRKVNPMLGIIVQHSFYDDEIAKARQNPEKMNEVICKLLNVYQGARVCKWLQGDQIRPRQIDRRIMDCYATQGWKVFCGLDFGGTDDIWAAAYLAVNYQTQQPEGRFFADLDLWITEKAMTESPNRPLYEMWVRDGWLHVCPGEVFSHEMAVNQIMYRAGYDEHGQLIVSPEKQIDITMFGYDPAQSIQPINQLKAWLQSLGIDAMTIKKMVIPVSQSFVTMNGLVQEVEYALLTDQPWLQLSMNPAWPWMFQNVKLEVSPNELKKPLKSGVNNKVDGIHALLDALYCFDFSEGMIQT